MAMTKAKTCKLSICWLLYTCLAGLKGRVHGFLYVNCVKKRGWNGFVMKPSLSQSRTMNHKTCLSFVPQKHHDHRHDRRRHYSCKASSMSLMLQLLPPSCQDSFLSSISFSAINDAHVVAMLASSIPTTIVAVGDVSAHYEGITTSSVMMIALWTLAFASSHIGMSAIRNTIIQGLGQFADDKLGLVNNPNWVLPSNLWPGDEVGGQQIFPNQEITGRQLYRILYTIISFATLGTALSLYVSSLHQSHSILPVFLENSAASITTATASSAPDDNSHSAMILQWIAAFSWGCSIASLVNPSPLSLVPVYEQQREVARTVNSQGINGSRINKGTTTTSNSRLVRKDTQKLIPYGMTRLTRHPLILPSAVWSIVTGLALGGTWREGAFFGVLAVYALCGCYAQDLRIINQEGSVGTVFYPISPTNNTTASSQTSSAMSSSSTSLQDFFEQTSFIPFGAVLDGRQSLDDIIKEVPWWALIVGTGIGYQIQQTIFQRFMQA